MLQLFFKKYLHLFLHYMPAKTPIAKKMTSHLQTLGLCSPKICNAYNVEHRKRHWILNAGRHMILSVHIKFAKPLWNVFWSLKDRGPLKNIKNDRILDERHVQSIDTTHDPSPLPLDCTFKEFPTHIEFTPMNSFFYSFSGSYSPALPPLPTYLCIFPH
jgi:hypothetical protein